VRAPLCKTGELDAAGELIRKVQQIERREIIDAADVIARRPFTSPEQGGLGLMSKG
jgi:hypothetical protein